VSRIASSPASEHTIRSRPKAIAAVERGTQIKGLQAGKPNWRSAFSWGRPIVCSTWVPAAGPNHGLRQGAAAQLQAVEHQVVGLGARALGKPQPSWPDFTCRGQRVGAQKGMVQGLQRFFLAV